MKEKYGVQPMKTWGSLPANMQDTWKQRTCDLVFTAARMGKRDIAKCTGKEAPGLSLSGLGGSTSSDSGSGGGASSSSSGSSKKGLSSWFGTMKQSESDNEAYFATLPLIAVMAATTTRCVCVCLGVSVCAYTFMSVRVWR